MKQLVRSALLRNPPLYSTTLRLLGKRNAELTTYLHLIQRGNSVFDVGANFGHYTLVFSTLAGADGQVHAFEPVSPTYQRLRDSVAQGAKLDNIRLNNSAASDSTGVVTLHMPGEDNGQASMATHDIASWSENSEVTSFECQTTRLDDYIKSEQIERLDFLKIDVEGAELLVLKGAETVLSQMQPVVFLEVCAAWTKDFGYAPNDIAELLASHGYNLFYLVDEEMKLLKEPQLELSAEKLRGSPNLLCLSPRHQALFPRVRAVQRLLRARKRACSAS